MDGSDWLRRSTGAPLRRGALRRAAPSCAELRRAAPSCAVWRASGEQLSCGWLRLARSMPRTGIVPTRPGCWARPDDAQRAVGDLHDSPQARDLYGAHSQRAPEKADSALLVGAYARRLTARAPSPEV